LKIKIWSSFTNPDVLPNTYGFLLLNVKEDILKNVFLFVCLSLQWKSMVTKTVCLPTFFKMSYSFVFDMTLG